MEAGTEPLMSFELYFGIGLVVSIVWLATEKLFAPLLQEPDHPGDAWAGLMARTMMAWLLWPCACLGMLSCWGYKLFRWLRMTSTERYLVRLEARTKAMEKDRIKMRDEQQNRKELAEKETKLLQRLEEASQYDPERVELAKQADDAEGKALHVLTLDQPEENDEEGGNSNETETA